MARDHILEPVGARVEFADVPGREVDRTGLCNLSFLAHDEMGTCVHQLVVDTEGSFEGSRLPILLALPLLTLDDAGTRRMDDTGHNVANSTSLVLGS